MSTGRLHKLNILFLASTDPRETSYGGQQRTHVLWKGLKSLGDVWTVIPVPHKRDEVRDDENRIYRLCLETRYSPGWFAQRLWARFLPPATVSWGTSLRNIRHLGLKFDAVVVRYLNMVGRMHPWRIAPMYVDVDDTPTVDYGLSHPKNTIRIKILERWQRNLCRRARHLWVPDPEQIAGLRDFPVSHLPNIPLLPEHDCRVETPRFEVDAETKRWTLLFIGYMAHRPNQVAIDWFLKTYWKELKKKFPKLRYRIAGGGLPESLKSEWARFEDVELLGFVENLNEVYDSGFAMLTPMRIGSGTCIKVLEALGRNIPVISTPQGLRGIPEEDWNTTNGIFGFEDFQSLTVAVGNVQSMLQGSVEMCPSAYVISRYSPVRIETALRESILRGC